MHYITITTVLVKLTLLLLAYFVSDEPVPHHRRKHVDPVSIPVFFLNQERAINHLISLTM